MEVDPSYALAVILAFLAGGFVPIMHLLFLRITRKPQRTIRYLFWSIALAFFLWTVLFLWKKGDVTQFLTEWVSGLSTLCVLCLGYMEIIFMTYRGFSLALISDILERGPLTEEEVMQTYGQGKGMDWMFERRIGAMEYAKLIDIKGENIRITPKGKVVGTVGLIYKRVFSLDITG